MRCRHHLSIRDRHYQHQPVTIAAYALAQFAAAYALIAQIGIYIHEGHGQFVKSVTEVIGMLH
jgi:hypothetical protein